MTPGAVVPARPWHRGSLGRRPANGPFGTLDRSPKSQIVIIGEPRHWPEIQKDFEAPQIACPFSRGPTPPSVDLPRRGGCSGASADAPSVSLAAALRRPPPSGPAPSGPRALFVADHPTSSRVLPPAVFGRTPSWVPPCVIARRPPRAEHPCHLPPPPPSRGGLCLPRLNSFNLLFLADPTARGSVLNLQCSQSQ